MLPCCPTTHRAEGGLTDGQAATLVRNERAAQSLQDEIEQLDEQLNDMARAALQGRRKAAEAEAAAEGGGAKKRRRLDDSDEEYLGESDDEDEFYDRTSGAVKVGGVVCGGRVHACMFACLHVCSHASASRTFDTSTPRSCASAGARHQRRPVCATTADSPHAPACPQSRKRAHQAQQQKPEQPTVETAESLYGKRAALQDEVARLEREVAQEQERLLEQDVPGSAAGAAAGAAGGGAAGGGAVDAGGDAGGDSLDAFMSVMEVQLEQDKLAGLQKELAATKVGCNRATACVVLCCCAGVCDAVLLCRSVWCCVAVQECVMRRGAARCCEVLHSCGGFSLCE
jgi:hypothetical protein